ANLHSPLLNFGVLGIRPRLYDFVIQLAGIVNPVGQDQQLNVILLNHHVLGMVLIKRGILGGGFVELVIAIVKASEHAVALGIIREILFRLTQEFLGLAGLVL